MGQHLDGEALGRSIESHIQGRGDRIFRMELLPAYSVDSDGDDYRRWLNGATEPTWERKRITLDMLHARADAGVVSRRVRVFTPELTSYERYASTFGYALNEQAGEDIRVLHRGEHRIPPLLGIDYWLLNDDVVIRMNYDRDGEFVGAEIEPGLLRRALDERDACWKVAEPFGQWWARHPELHTRQAA